MIPGRTSVATPAFAESAVGAATTYEMTRCVAERAAERKQLAREMEDGSWPEADAAPKGPNLRIKGVIGM